MCVVDNCALKDGKTNGAERNGRCVYACATTVSTFIYIRAGNITAPRGKIQYTAAATVASVRVYGYC